MGRNPEHRNVWRWGLLDSDPRLLSKLQDKFSAPNGISWAMVFFELSPYLDCDGQDMCRVRPGLCLHVFFQWLCIGAHSPQRPSSFVVQVQMSMNGLTYRWKLQKNCLQSRRPAVLGLSLGACKALGPSELPLGGSWSGGGDVSMFFPSYPI